MQHQQPASEILMKFLPCHSFTHSFTHKRLTLRTDSVPVTDDFVLYIYIYIYMYIHLYNEDNIQYL